MSAQTITKTTFPTQQFVIGGHVGACLSTNHHPPFLPDPLRHPTYIHIAAMDDKPRTGPAQLRLSLHQSSFCAQLQTFRHGQDVPTHCLYQDLLLNCARTGWHATYLQINPDTIKLTLVDSGHNERILCLARPTAYASFDLAVELAPQSLRLPHRKARFVIQLNAPPDADAAPFATIIELLQPRHRQAFVDDCGERRRLWTSTHQYVTTLQSLTDGNILVNQSLQTASSTSPAPELA